MSDLRLNLGCADKHFDGWVNVDLDRADVNWNLAAMPWPWEVDSVNEIMASHILEHFDKLDGYRFLNECKRILKPGGTLHIAVPDLDKFIRAKVLNKPELLNGYKWDDLNYLGGGDETETRPGWRHLYIYSWESLAYMCKAVGFAVVARREVPMAIDNQDHTAISLYADAMKGLS